MHEILNSPLFCEEKVILVDDFDNEIGSEEKLKAHQEGKLHRAISVFLFNSSGELLLQKRALTKYHSGGLWSNTCCSHPRPNEAVLDAAKRRLWEEMGIRCELHKILDFTYKAFLDQQLIEHEFDHVFIGTFNGIPQINTKEACEWKWADPEWIAADIAGNPGEYTEWFKMILKKVLESFLPCQ